MGFRLRVLPIVLSPLGDSGLDAALVHGISQFDAAGVISIREDVAQVVPSPTLAGQLDFPTLGPQPAPPASRIGVRLIRHPPGGPGPLFRSGFLDVLPQDPSGPTELEVVEAPWLTIDEPSLNQLLASRLPTTQKGTTIDSGTIVVNEGTITVRAMGSRSAGPLGIVNFTATSQLTISPVTAMDKLAEGPQPLIQFAITQTPAVQLTGSGPSIPEAGAIIALLALLVGPMIGREMVSVLNAQVNQKVPMLIGAALSRVGGPSTLPASITASLERIVVGTYRPTTDAPSTRGLHLLVALGSFSGVVATLFPASAGGGGRGCSTAPALIAAAGAAIALGLRSRRP